MAVNPLSSACERVYEVVREIPAGKVSTYGDIAKMSGVGSPRLVGSCLHVNPYPQSVPCHRVVNASGRLAPTFAFGGALKQQEMLENEGAVFDEAIVDLSQSRWIPETLAPQQTKPLVAELKKP